MVDDAIVEELKKYLADDDYKKLLNLCLEPKKRSEMTHLASQTKMFQMVNNLMKLRALEIQSGRYITAAFVRGYL